MNRKMVKRENANAYVDYFLRKHNISKKRQPNLKEAILQACENPELPITSESLNLNEKNRICVKSEKGNDFLDISTIHKNISSMCDFVELIVEKIMDLENEELLSLRIFNLERKMETVQKYFEDMDIYHMSFK